MGRWNRWFQKVFRKQQKDHSSSPLSSLVEETTESTSDPNFSEEINSSSSEKEISIVHADKSWLKHMRSSNHPTTSSCQFIFDSDVLFIVFQFLRDDYKFLLSKCKLVCKQWYECVTRVPLSLKLGYDHFNQYKKALFSNYLKPSTFYNTNVTELFLSTNRVLTANHFKCLVNNLSSRRPLTFEEGSTGGANPNNTTPQKIVHFSCSDELGVNHIRALFHTYPSLWNHLKHLDLFSNKLSENHIEVFVSSGFSFSHLETLYLSHNAINDEGVKILMERGFRSLGMSYSLKKLALDSNEISKEAVKVIAENPNMKNLTCLKLGMNMIGDAGIQSLTSSENLQNLTELNLGLCKFTTEGAKLLSTSVYLRSLRSLSISANNINQEGAQYLSQPGTSLQNLTELDLNFCKIGDDGLEKLMSGHCIQNVTDLSLRGNDISERGIEFLAHPKKRPFQIYAKLQFLDLSQNSIGDTGVKKLVNFSNEQLSHLRDLNLFGTDIGDEGMQAVMNCEQWKKSLQYCRIGKNPNISAKVRGLNHQRFL
ncbi:hypothetical protein FDP41_013359 [Naegleria fowleri]|uniref:F-box domain-containing protein n=1 Tax=Naegleria fowleri TaxID=5763 RepID=A0A6A5C3T0_NAEFO|nr:uncharacterized protein FDP41_013359 [Naegleria fowleri]KAF0980145.1 hypothetical protein FDP41_013359 [Naegleria fowleri]CAG4714641.1 unnamed protein product [Naegleria fowleri]